MTQIAPNPSMTWQCLINAGKFSADKFSADKLSTDKLGKNELLNKATISPSDRAFAYGDGFFTTMGAHHGQILWLAQHKQRLNSHLNALHLYLSKEDQQSVWNTVIATASHMGQGVIKLIICRQSQALRGYAFSANNQNNACQVWLGVLADNLLTENHFNKDTDRDLNSASINFIHPNISFFVDYCSIFTSKHYASAIPMQLPITAVCLQAQLSCLPANLVGLKTLNRLDNVMAAGELERYKQNERNKHKSSKLTYVGHSVGEGLVKDVSGQWVEGVMSNVFYQLASDDIDSIDSSVKRDNTDISDNGNNNGESDSNLKPWYTPPIDVSGVNGVMRQVIMQAAEHQAMSKTNAKHAVIERRLADADLPRITSLFFCNAVRGIMPVSHLIDLQGDIITLTGSKSLTDQPIPSKS